MTINEYLNSYSNILFWTADFRGMNTASYVGAGFETGRYEIAGLTENHPRFLSEICDCCRTLRILLSEFNTAL
jgi:hypothetical protein